MNRSSVKLKCFTIIELVIAMLLMGIVVSIGYTALQFTTSYFNTVKENSLNTLEFNKLKRAMHLDVAKSSAIWLTQEGIHCEIKEGSVSYQFSDSIITRLWNTTSTDTFRFVILDRLMIYDHAPQDSLGGLINQMMLELAAKNNDTLLLIIDKEYDAQFLFNHTLKTSYDRNKD